jgi:hypothetical protein
MPVLSNGSTEHLKTLLQPQIGRNRMFPKNLAISPYNPKILSDLPVITTPEHAENMEFAGVVKKK